MIEIEVKALKLALRGITQVIEARNTIPILSNVLLVASTRELRMTGTDLDIQIQRRVAGDGKTAFTTTVGAAVLAAIVGKLPADGVVKLALDTDKAKLNVSCGRSRFSLATLPVDDFPELLVGDDVSTFSLAAPVLATMIETVRFAISTEETRYYLNGIFLHATDGQLRAVATDGHRLAKIAVALPEGAEDLPDVILPRKCVQVVFGLAGDSPDVVEIALSKTKVRFTIGDDVLTSKLIDGTFPDYTRVIPTANDKRLAFDPREMEQGVDRVATVASEKTRAVAVTLKKDMIKLDVTSPENGVATEDVPADYGSPEIRVGFNARYMADVLKRLGGDTAVATFSDSAGPVLFRETEGASALFVLMPMRV